ncbi:hypothetical protein CD111_08865 [Mammaliicoccus stepanovicii]|nr:hypothetical protein CD111_08865 [Mammaliicoccus stepanovicii]
MTYLKYSNHPHFKYQIGYLDHSTSYSNLTIQTLINQTLLIEGANLKTREQYARKILKISKLLPILIHATQDFSLFPITSKNHLDYILINSKHVDSIEQHNNHCSIIFTNNALLNTTRDLNIISKKMGESLRLIHHQKLHLSNL